MRSGSEIERRKLPHFPKCLIYLCENNARQSLTHSGNKNKNFVQAFGVVRSTASGGLSGEGPRPSVERGGLVRVTEEPARIWGRSPGSEGRSWKGSRWKAPAWPRRGAAERLVQGSRPRSGSPARRKSLLRGEAFS